MTLQNSITSIGNKPHLNSFAFEEDGMLYWWASWYARILGYKSIKTLNPTIQKAKENCSQIGLMIEDNFKKTERKIEGKKITDYKLTKFACFLVAMHADNRKRTVKNAQVYFLNEFEELAIITKDQEFSGRKIAREDIKELNNSLNKSAARSRVRNYSFFTNEGFIGMYNSTIRELKKERGIPEKENLYDHMGLTELAAHIFRIALTSERLSHLHNRNESNAAKVHWKIGAKIREMIKESAGVYPEHLKTKINLNELEKSLRKASERLNTIEIKSIT